MPRRAAEGDKRLREAAEARAGQCKALQDGRGRSIRQKMAAQEAAPARAVDCRRLRKASRGSKKAARGGAGMRGAVRQAWQ